MGGPIVIEQPLSGWTVAAIIIGFFVIYLTYYFLSTWLEQQKQFGERLKRLEEQQTNTKHAQIEKQIRKMLEL